MIFCRLKNRRGGSVGSSHALGSGLFACILLAGCAAGPAPHATAPEVLIEARVRIAAQSALKEGIELYNRGDFPAAIKLLGSDNAIWAADKAIQLEALKYMAFSYCVTARPLLCKQEFERALKLDPNFDLAQGEKGHPLWGPVFDRLKKGK